MSQKLLFIGSNPPPFGGVAVINQTYQDVMSKSYNIISFDTSRPNNSENINGHLTFRDFMFSFYLMKKFLSFSFKNKNEIANIYITSGISFYRSILFYLVGSIFSLKFITHLHSKTSNEYFLTKHRLPIFIKFINKYSRKIVVLSKYHMNFFCSNGLEKNKCAVIENFVNDTYYSCSKKEKINDMLFVGRLSEQKGIIDLVKALKILKDDNIDYKLHLVGEFVKPETRLKVMQYIERNDLNRNIKLYGNLFGNSKYELYKKCSIFIFPSHFENSPVVLKEAIASNMAIVCSDIKANRQILDQFDNKIYHRVKDPQNIAEKIKLVLMDKDLRNNLMDSSSSINDFKAENSYKILNRIVSQINI